MFTMERYLRPVGPKINSVIMCGLEKRMYGNKLRRGFQRCLEYGCIFCYCQAHYISMTRIIVGTSSELVFIEKLTVYDWQKL